MEDFKKPTRNSSKPPNSRSKSSRSFENNTAIVGLGIVAAMDDSEQAFASARSSISAILATRSSSAAANSSNPIDIAVSSGSSRGAAVMEFCESFDSVEIVSGACCSFRISEFLKICFLCGKDLHGKDIFMYRGEKAFCSAECRSQQIANDDRREKCGSGLNYSVSPCSGPMMFFAGVVAA